MPGLPRSWDPLLDRSGAVAAQLDSQSQQFVVIQRGDGDSGRRPVETRHQAEAPEIQQLLTPVHVDPMRLQETNLDPGNVGYGLGW